MFKSVNKRCVTLVLILVASIITATSPITTNAADPIFTLLKAFGIGYVVQTFAPQMNTAVNAIMQNNKVMSSETTKVVPIISLGNGAHIGAVQVTGSSTQVNKVAAVAQLEVEGNESWFRAKALVPVNSFDVRTIQRVSGVGISAVLDIRL